MFNRVYYKERAKKILKGHWGIAFLIGILMILTTGGFSSGGGSGVNNRARNNYRYEQRNDTNGSGYNAYQNKIANEIQKEAENQEKGYVGRAFYKIFQLISATIVIPILIGILLLSIVVRIFVLNPLSVGLTNWYRTMDLGQKIMDYHGVTYIFNKAHYLNVVKIMFLKDLYIFLWTLLLFIPGIIKYYEYYFIPLILAENPSMDIDDVFLKSKTLTTSNKFNLFVMELSFIGWAIASAITCFLTIPLLESYRLQSIAAAYHHLSGYNVPDEMTASNMNNYPGAAYNMNAQGY